MNPEAGPGPQHTGNGKSASNAERGAYYQRELGNDNIGAQPEAVPPAKASKADKLAYYQQELGNDAIGTQGETEPAPAPEEGAAEEPTPEAAEAPASAERREQAEDGETLLAQNLDRVAAESGPEGVHAYMESLLAPEAAETAPRAEREAAFGMLARAQQERIRSDATGAADRTDAKNKEGSGPVDRNTAEAEPRLQQRARRFGESYDAMRRGRIEGRVLAEKSGDIGHEMSSFTNGPLLEHTAAIARSALDQATNLQTLGVELNQFHAHEVAITEAQKTLADGYEGEPKSVMETIDPGLAKELAADITDAMAQARTEGKNPADVLAQIQAEPQLHDARTVQRLTETANVRHAALVRARQVIDAQSAEIKQAVGSFRRAGENYRSMRDTGELPQIGGVQTASLRRINGALRMMGEARQRIFA